MERWTRHQVRTALVLTAVLFGSAPHVQAAESTARTDETRLAEADRLDVRVAQLCGEAKYADAVPLAQEALKIREEVHREDHADIAVSLNNLAELYRGLAQYTLAEPLALRALKVQEATSGLEHTNTAMSLNNLAALYADMGEYAKAKPLYQRALAIWESTAGREAPDAAGIMSNLAVLEMKNADYAEAEPLLQRALRIREKALGPEDPDTALSLHNLAGLYSSKGDYAKAEALLQRALKIRENVLGPEHPDTAASLNNLAALYLSMADYGQAEPLLSRALDILRRHLDRTAAVQSERQQLAMLRANQGALHAWLSVAPRTSVEPSAMAARSLLGKGQVAMRQESLQRLRSALEKSGDKVGLDLFGEWESASRRWAILATGSAEPGPWSAERLERLKEVSERKERLERDLAARSAVYREAERRANPSLGDLRRALAVRPGGVLVDLIEYTQFSPPRSGKGKLEREVRVLAFVVRGDTEEVRRIELGPAQPIQEAVVQWREGLDKGGSVGATGQRLRELVWLKLEPALAPMKTVVLSPDGALCRLPFGALPGSTPGSYLLEEYTFALVPIPRLLPDLLAAPAANDPPSLVVLGNVDYGGAAGLEVASSRAAARSGEVRSTVGWPRLPATELEAEAVRGAFGRRFGPASSVMLGASEATEGAFRLRAPQAGYLHVATHGYFADPRVQSALAAPVQTSPESTMSAQGVTGWNPGLLSGLVLAGANLPPTEGQDDGILTALEVQALDLRGVQLTVLSACETGLGESAGGEGLLGLQRAFQLAGAKTVVASLWKVPDAATQELMGEFYRRLWEGKQGRLEALRGAQLWMLAKERNRARVGAATDRGVKLPEAERRTGAVSPRAWAAFVLSGDWR